MRTRTFIDRLGRKKCPHITVGKQTCTHIHTHTFMVDITTLFSWLFYSFHFLQQQSISIFFAVEKQKCMQPECSINDLEVPDPDCPVTAWSDFSPCSATCGRGVQIRTRLLLVEPEREGACKAKKELHQQRQCQMRTDCVFDYETARNICSQPSDVGSCRGIYKRFYYDPIRQSCEEFEYGGCRGNQNNFLTKDICLSSCSLIRATVPSSSSSANNNQATRPRVQTQRRSNGPAV